MSRVLRGRAHLRCGARSYLRDPYWPNARDCPSSASGLLTTFFGNFLFFGIDNSFKGRSLFEQFLVAFTLSCCQLEHQWVSTQGFFWEARSGDHLGDQIFTIGLFGIPIVGFRIDQEYAGG